MNRGFRIAVGVFLLNGNAAFGQEYSTDEHVVCSAVQSLLKASASDFDSIKLKVKRRFLGGSDWIPSIFIGKSSDCDGQTERDKSSSVNCTMDESASVGVANFWYSSIVSELQSCLDASFVFRERQGGKPQRLFTPVKEASFKVRGRGVRPDGPAVRVRLDNFHSENASSYDVSIWVDAMDKE